MGGPGGGAAPRVGDMCYRDRVLLLVSSIFDEYSGSLVIMVSGVDSVISACNDILSVISSKIIVRSYSKIENLRTLYIVLVCRGVLITNIRVFLRALKAMVARHERGGIALPPRRTFSSI